jgi:hypothetical protein
LITANADSKYHRLLQLAATLRLRAVTAAVNITYTASVPAVQAITPIAIRGFGA